MEWSSRNSMAQEKLGLLAKSPRDSASSPEKMGDVSQQLIRMKTDTHKIPTTVCGLQRVAQSIEMVVVILSIQFSPNSFTSSVLFSSRKSALVILSIQFSPNSFTSGVLFSSRKSALMHPVVRDVTAFPSRLPCPPAVRSVNLSVQQTRAQVFSWTYHHPPRPPLPI